MANSTRTPWMLGRQFRPKSPASLRDALLQVAYVDLVRLRLMCEQRTETWSKVLAISRLMRPLQFAELCRVAQIDLDAIQPAQDCRRHNSRWKVA